MYHYFIYFNIYFIKLISINIKLILIVCMNNNSASAPPVKGEVKGETKNLIGVA